MNLFQLNFNAAGALENPAELERLSGHLKKEQKPAVLFLAHGWLNDAQTAGELFSWYARGLEPMAVCGVKWPSHPLKPNAAGLVSKGLELTSYYVMKERAAEVGAAGLGPVLMKLHAAAPDAAIHLAGHSFGARLVTAAAAATVAGGGAGFVKSMTLIQAAFSQFSFAPEGGYRDVLSKRAVAGPIAVTHSRHDKAVGEAYPVASLIKRQNASAIGGPNDPYGGLGRNGAQHLTTDECIGLNLGDLLSLRQMLAYPVVNLNADRVVQGHSDIYKLEILETIRAFC